MSETNTNEVRRVLNLSVTDYFAGQALAGCMAYFNPASGDHHTNSTAEQTAEFCYKIADAMLAESNRRAGK